MHSSVFPEGIPSLLLSAMKHILQKIILYSCSLGFPSKAELNIKQLFGSVNAMEFFGKNNSFGNKFFPSPYPTNILNERFEMLRDPIFCLEQHGLLAATLRVLCLVSHASVIFLRHYGLFLLDSMNIESFCTVNGLNYCDVYS